MRLPVVLCPTTVQGGGLGDAVDPTRGFSGREADRRGAKSPAPTRRIRGETAASRSIPKPARRQVPTEVTTAGSAPTAGGRRLLPGVSLVDAIPPIEEPVTPIQLGSALDIEGIAMLLSAVDCHAQGVQPLMTERRGERR